jgi:DNA-binding LacI/PurR family transcriptional regulator
MTQRKAGGRRNLSTASLVEQIHREWILDRAPARLPPERVLAARYQVSRPTIAAALRLLEEQGRVLRLVGQGTFTTPDEGIWWRPYAGKAVAVNFAQANYILADPFCAAVLCGVAHILMQRGIGLLLQTRDWRYARQAAPAAYFEAPNILGILLFGPPPPDVLAALKQLDRPLLALDYDATATGLSSFCLDDSGAGAVLARRLFKLGHRRIAAIFESPQKPVERQDPAWGERRRGFLGECQRLGLSPPQEVLLDNRGPSAAASQAIARLLRQPESQRPTAFFAPDRRFAQELLARAAEAGLEVPRDLTVVGCGDRWERDGVTAVRFDGSELGFAAAARMLYLLTHPQYGHSYSRPTAKRIKGRYISGTTHARAR